MNKRERFLFFLDHRKARNECSLNGLWQLQPGTAYESPREFQSVVPVPGLVDLAEPPYDWNGPDFHWYRTEIELAAHEEAPLVFLKIGQAQYGTAVWLNGKEVGSSISCYTSQEYRIDPALQSGLNELIVRVGAKRTLPPESAVGKDQEKERFIPGVWGDVSLTFSGNPRIKHVQVIPHIDKSVAEARITLENTSGSPKQVTLTLTISEKETGNAASKQIIHTVAAFALQWTTVAVFVPIENLHLWSPESPFLYALDTVVVSDDVQTDRVTTVFGMREFEIKGKDFYLNGKPILLRGGNIAFHRFLSDNERKLLPWNREWIKRVLIDIPKEHHFNFFRSHLGQMYNAWYEIADEHGMLIQNEWQFWGTTGTKEQIGKEFTQWILDNCNHPSIVMWDALNESTDEVIQREIVPAMKQLDPTRPWESVDVVEDHPYIYSLGPVLNNEKFGFTRALAEIERSETPSVLNEFLWWWLDREGKPTSLMKGVMERWIGTNPTREELLAHQAFLAQELVELFRRTRVNAIQPFVYLSNNDGPTGHWFLGPVRNLNPKPVLAALKNAFAPFGVSVELWDRHFMVGEKRSVTVWVFNDIQEQREGSVRYGITDREGKWLSQNSAAVAVAATDVVRLPVEITFPSTAGPYTVQAELFDGTSSAPVSVSRKIAHVFGQVSGSSVNGVDADVAVLERTGEYRSFLEGLGIQVVDAGSNGLQRAAAVLVGEGMLTHARYTGIIGNLTRYISEGGTLILVEPEYGVRSKVILPVLQGLDVTLERRDDGDRGGYDSYVFASDHDHPLWDGIERDQLKMFNGAYGGEIVSQHNVVPSIEPMVHARCGLGLAIPAVMEITCGSGRVIISRLQLRERLMKGREADTLYGRRPDPVLHRYVVNLVRYAAHHTLASARRLSGERPQR